MAWLDEFVSRAFHWIYSELSPSSPPQHLLTGKSGEQKAYRFLRRLGYRIVATNFRTSRTKGEIDLIAWKDGTLCFVEVKTRTQEGLRPPEAAVTLAKQEHLIAVAREYVRRLPGRHPPHCRFDVVSVILRGESEQPELHLHPGAFDWDAGQRRSRWRDFDIRPRGPFRR